MTLRRALSYAVVPLSAVPLAAAAAYLAPSVEHRVNELRARPSPAAVPSPAPVRERMPTVKRTRRGRHR